MVDRENVIKGLQESAAYFRSSFDAMYGTVACEMFRNWTDAIEQAIALLKAQEPEVMTGAELTDAELIEEIRKAPIVLKPNVDAVPVVHARWVEETDHSYHWHCSKCKQVWGVTKYFMNYCPNCGAKMDGDA